MSEVWLWWFMVWISLGLSIRGFAQIFKSTGLQLFPYLKEFQLFFLFHIWKMFSHNFSRYFFQHRFLSPLFLRLQWHKYYIFCYHLTAFCGSVHFFSAIFSLLFSSGSSYRLFHFTDSFLCPLCSAVFKTFKWLYFKIF